MNLDELASRLAMLEEGESDRRAAQDQKAFIDQYGTMFSGDEGIGMAILAEMNRRGVPSAAIGADRVVQEILDGIRQECSMILDKIKADRETVGAVIEQVQEIQNAVDAAVGGDGNATGDGVLDVPVPPPGAEMMPGDPGMMPPPPDGLGEMPMEGAPMAGDMMPPMEGAPMAGEMMPGPEMPLPPEEPLPPPPPIASDQRVKKLIQPRPKAPSGWKPPAHLLAGARGRRD
jgi:hypothetical protein